MAEYPFPLSLQIVLPPDYLSDGATRERLSMMADRGLTGVEINFGDPGALNPDELDEYLRGFGVPMTYFASGFTAKTFGLSLSALDEEVRSRSVEMMRLIIRKFAGRETGIIVGFFKGGPGPEKEKRAATLRRSLADLMDQAENAGVRICLEATNRYESAVGNALDDTRAILDGFPPSVAEILPDTFHMNIEESDPLDALTRNLDAFRNVHISDNNRFLPGFGAIDFAKILGHLKSIGYQGGIAMEGNFRDSFESDLVRATDYLAKVQRQIEG